MTYQMYQAYDVIITVIKVVVGTWGLYTAYKVATGKPKKDA